MAKINLLPWRAERRKQRQHEFYITLALSAVCGIILSFIIYAYYSRQISGQNERNAYLQQEIAKVKDVNLEIASLDKKRAQLLARKRVIEQLQSNRSQMIHLLDSLVKTIPDGVVLTSLKQEGDILTLEGRSQSNTSVSSYMRNLEGSGWMQDPDLSIIEARKSDSSGSKSPSVDTRALPYVFGIRVKLSSPKASNPQLPQSSKSTNSTTEAGS